VEIHSRACWTREVRFIMIMVSKASTIIHPIPPSTIFLPFLETGWYSSIPQANFSYPSQLTLKASVTLSLRSSHTRESPDSPLLSHDHLSVALVFASDEPSRPSGSKPAHQSNPIVKRLPSPRTRFLRHRLRRRRG
jgi:hypothetical protein